VFFVFMCVFCVKSKGGGGELLITIFRVGWVGGLVFIIGACLLEGHFLENIVFFCVCVLAVAVTERKKRKKKKKKNVFFLLSIHIKKKKKKNCIVL